MPDDSSYSHQPAESSPQTPVSGSPDAEAVLSYFLNRAAVAEALARNYDAEANVNPSFGTYIPAVIGAIITASVGVYGQIHRMVGVIWILGLGVAFLIVFLAISFGTNEIARSEKRQMAETLRNLARSLKSDASS